jgi:hypothetical protein
VLCLLTACTTLMCNSTTTVVLKKYHLYDIFFECVYDVYVVVVGLC